MFDVLQEKEDENESFNTGRLDKLSSGFNFSGKATSREDGAKEERATVVVKKCRFKKLYNLTIYPYYEPTNLLINPIEPRYFQEEEKEEQTLKKMKKSGKNIKGHKRSSTDNVNIKSSDPEKVTQLLDNLAKKGDTLSKKMNGGSKGQMLKNWKKDLMEKYKS